MRLTLSILLTPAIITIIYILGLVLLGQVIGPNKIFIITSTYFFTLVGLVVFGLPISALLKKYNKLDKLHFTICGGIAGIIYSVIALNLVMLFWGYPTLLFETRTVVSGFILGILTALIFFAITGITEKPQEKVNSRAIVQGIRSL